MKVAIIISDVSPVWPVCVLCASIHTVAPDVLLKYSIAEVVGGSWMECSRCLGLSDHQVHDIQSWYTTCVERSYTVLDIFYEECEQKSKDFVTEIEKRMSCLPQFQEIQRVLKGRAHLCVKDLCKFISPCMNQGSCEKIDLAQNVLCIWSCWHFFDPGLIPFTLVPVFACKNLALLTKHLTIRQLQVQVYV